MDRPAHLNTRPILGVAFGTTAQLHRAGGSRNQYGEWEPEAETITTIHCATAPGSDDRNLDESGVQREGDRRFWTTDLVIPVAGDTAGDVISYQGVRYIVTDVQAWADDLYEILAVREEDQPSALPT